MSVLNPTNASAFIKSIDEFAVITKKAWDSLPSNRTMGATIMNSVLHTRLKERLTDSIQAIRSNMTSRFVVMLPFDDMQSMMMSPATLYDLQRAGKLMTQQYTQYNYKLGDKVTIRVSCRGGREMPSILFPNEELTIFSEEFLDLVRPLYLISKSWMDVHLAFETVCKLIQDTRELNFYVPWLRLVIPQDQDLTNQFNAAFRVSRWLDLERETKATTEMITRQIRYILKNEYTPKRTWMPSELVHMVRQGEELITQYNIMKNVPSPNTNLMEDMVAIEVIVTVKDHPTIKWATEASTHRTMKEVERLKKLDAKKERTDEW
jgi:hypothetical protein